MKQLPEDAAALMALAALGVGVGLIVGALLGIVAGMGAALVVVSGLILLYLVLPDRGAP